GSCGAGWICAMDQNGVVTGPGPNGLTCVQVVGPSPEVCNGFDDDCNGLVDDNPTDAGSACGALCPGGLLANCVGHCRAGAIVCAGGGRVCMGSVGPASETCNGIDDNCNGVIDDVPGVGAPCSGGTANTAGACT